jgi:(p)ppGpp synthase/HD superfamily hydrolase
MITIESLETDPIALTAAEFADRAYKNVKPRIGGEPYRTHPRSVRDRYVKLSHHPMITGVIAAEYHDIVEDCFHEDGRPYTFDDCFYSLDHLELPNVDSNEIIDVSVEAIETIRWLTKAPRPKHISKLDWHRPQYALIGNSAPDLAIEIKVCDRLDNLSGPESWNKRFLDHYIADTELLIEGLKGRIYVELIEERLEEIKNQYS